ncbi:hypothetical protein GOV04_02215 [Candidatus Woesearchaeota archaeon]|nr:hypothetical protein [Candidatus Woesearchaeota archaeon]
MGLIIRLLALAALLLVMLVAPASNLLLLYLTANILIEKSQYAIILIPGSLSCFLFLNARLSHDEFWDCWRPKSISAYIKVLKYVRVKVK